MNNLLIYLFAEALMHTMNIDLTYKQMVFDSINNRTDHQISLLAIAEANNDIKKVLDEQLDSLVSAIVMDDGYYGGLDLNQLASDVTTENALEFLTDLLCYQGDCYYPEVYFVDGLPYSNPDEIIVAIGEAVSPDTSSSDEFAAGWENMEKILIDPGLASSCSKSFIFVSNGTDEVMNVTAEYIAEPDLRNSSVITPRSASFFGLSLVSFQLKHPYYFEGTGSGRIELTWFAQMFNENGSQVHTGDQYQNKVHRNTVKNSHTIVFNTPQHMSEFPISNLESVPFIFFGFYEQDVPFNSSKKIKCTCPCGPNGSSIEKFVKVQTRYTSIENCSEWYYFLCGRASNFWPYDGYVLPVSNERSSFAIKRDDF